MIRNARRRLTSLGALCVLLLAAGGCGEGDELAEIRRLHAEERFEETLDPLRAMLDQDPDQPEVNLLLGEALMRTGDSSSAIWPLRRALESPEHTVEAGLLLGRAELASRTPRDVLSAIEPVLEVDPDNVEALVIRVQASLKADRNEDALADVERVAEIDPGNLHVLVPRVLALIELDRIDEAEEALSIAREVLATTDRELGENVRGRLCVANALFAFEKGELERASELYVECLESYPDNRLVVGQVVAYYDRMREPEKGTETLQEALERTGDPYFRSALAKRVGRRGDLEEQERLLREDAEERSAPQAWFALADFLVVREEFDEAAAAFEKALAAEPDPPPMTRFAYVDTLIQAKRFDEARQALDTIEQEHMRDLLRGRLLLATGDPEGALRAFEAGILLWPDNAGARFLAGKAAEQIGDFDRAIEEYREAMRRRRDRGATDAPLHLARILAAKGGYQGAFSALYTFLQANPRNEEALLLMIHVSDALSQSKPIGQALSRLLSMGQGATAMAIQVEILARRSGAEAAIESADESGLDLTDPQNAVALGAVLEQHAGLGQHEEARARIEAALEAHPDAAAFHELAARALLAAGGSVEEARAGYERALELDAENAGALAGLAEIAARKGDRERAIDLYDRASAVDPDDTDSAWAVIGLLQEAGRAEEAERRLAALVERNPRDARAAHALAKSLAERGADLGRALSYAKRAAYFTTVTEAPELLGRIHLMRGEHAAAVEVLSAVVDSRPEATSARYHLGLALAAAGERERARKAFDAVIRAEGAEAEQARIEIGRLDHGGSS